jgi:hypothetical protein
MRGFGSLSLSQQQRVVEGRPETTARDHCPRVGWGLSMNEETFFSFLVEGAYTQQGRAHIRRPHPGWAARPALMSRAAHAVESKAVVRIEVAVSPRPCLGCAVELVLRVAPLRRGVPPR